MTKHHDWSYWKTFGFKNFCFVKLGCWITWFLPFTPLLKNKNRLPNMSNKYYKGRLVRPKRNRTTNNIANLR